MSSSDKLPLNDVLAAIDRRDFDWYSNLSDDMKKKWSSWLFLRYASSVKGRSRDDVLLNTNEFVNKNYVDLYKHDELMWKLFCLTGTGKKQYHEWIKAPHSKKKTDKVSEFVSEIYPHLKSDELDLYLKLNDEDEIKQLALDAGKSEKEIEEIFGKKKRKKK
jgi:hypothetical protein